MLFFKVTGRYLLKGIFIFMKQIVIYGLCNPETKVIRYIGKSERVKQRYQNHLNETYQTHKTNWIKSLKRKGLKPELIILEKITNESIWQEREREWIKTAGEFGFKLVNSTDGGDGVLNISGEGKKRMLATWKGRKHKPESIEKMRIRSSQQIKTEKSKNKLSKKMAGREITWKDKLQKANRKFDDAKLKLVIEDLNNGMKVIDAAKKYGVHRTTITKIKKGEYKTFKQKTYNYIKPRRYHNF
jgi:hypothetical protein